MMLWCNVTLIQFRREEEFVDLEKEFEQNVLNSTVYLISMTMQISNVAVNYRVGINYNIINVIIFFAGSSIHGQFEREPSFVL